MQFNRDQWVEAVISSSELTTAEKAELVKLYRLMGQISSHAVLAAAVRRRLKALSEQTAHPSYT